MEGAQRGEAARGVERAVEEEVGCGFPVWWAPFEDEVFKCCTEYFVDEIEELVFPRHWSAEGDELGCWRELVASRTDA